MLAFALGEETASLTLSAERRKPQVTARQFLAVSVDSGVVKYEATFFHDILYSGVKSLRIDIPADLAPDVRNNTTGIREKLIEPAPKDLREGYVAWNFTGETEFVGSAVIKLVWQRKLEKLDVGKSVELALPYLRPALIDRDWGQIVLTKAETMDVREVGELTGIRPIDPQHDLMPGVRVPNAARAFEFHGNWALRGQRDSLQARGSQANKHREGGHPDGRHSWRTDVRAGSLPHSQRPPETGPDVTGWGGV